MYETLITNIVNNIFHIVWFNNLVLEPKYDKRKTLLITILTGIVFQSAVLAAIRLGLPRMVFFLGAYIVTAIVFGSVFLFVLSASSLSLIHI